ncbi:MAG: hypothetical protein AB1346_10960 [Thermodesulfobacteriota bacterium]
MPIPADLPALLLKTYLPPFAFFSMFVVLRFSRDIPLYYFTKDPLALAEAPFYYGILSNAGILLWCSAAVLCFFCSFALGKKDNEFRSYLLLSGIVTTVLMTDDMLQVHEHIFPNLLQIGETWVQLSYFLMIGAYSVVFFRKIVKTNFLFLIFAYMFFALSMYSDTLPHGASGHFYIEDGSKFFGIFSWFAYFLQLCSKLVAERARPVS